MRGRMLLEEGVTGGERFFFMFKDSVHSEISRFSGDVF